MIDLKDRGLLANCSVMPGNPSRCLRTRCISLAQCLLATGEILEDEGVIRARVVLLDAENLKFWVSPHSSP